MVDREWWNAGWEEPLAARGLVCNRRTTRVAVSAEGDDAFAVIDADAPLGCIGREENGRC